VKDLESIIKKQVGYTTKQISCKSCIYYSYDMSNDSFGPGHSCERNPDFSFIVDDFGRCNKHKEKV